MFLPYNIPICVKPGNKDIFLSKIPVTERTACITGYIYISNLVER